MSGATLLTKFTEEEDEDYNDEDYGDLEQSLIGLGGSLDGGVGGALAFGGGVFSVAYFISSHLGRGDPQRVARRSVLPSGEKRGVLSFCV